MGKPQDSNAWANCRFVAYDSVGWTKSPDEVLFDEVMNTVWTILDKGISACKRKIDWVNGQALTINPTIKRIHPNHPHFPLECIEAHLIGWLELLLISPHL